jgi:hypothetical protein
MSYIPLNIRDETRVINGAAHGFWGNALVAALRMTRLFNLC